MPPTTQHVARTDAGLASELRVAVMRLRRRLAIEREPGNDIGIGVMAVLACLYRRGELSVGELAAYERVQPPSMTRAVRKLEEKGYVARRPHETDGRQVLVSLTDAGRDLVLADRRRRDEWLASRLRGLSADDRAALRAALPILDRLAAED
ncbi:MarR family transcriptional regulator [Nocardioides zeae]|uniref:MarR family transcriptional regulator n=1 Tax=Nocardioides imazamoxiresistens TaxID=3231893 RepID=A0ABU3PYF5_9ACTN|nr:MarR family transcriptional regulator [Nocardioides zeae]MDT9594288.1 MarR family transcriptional regulator [Nocardioides zeae]